MPFGRAVTLFMMDENPLGLRQVELDNWTGIAFIGPRSSLEAARGLEELKSAGVYLLLHALRPDDGVHRIYVGETEDFSERGIDRNERLPDWEHFVVFQSKDRNLTKAHVRWLEARVHQALGKATGRVILANGNVPPGAGLPKPAEASMETYLANMLYVLSALGMDFFKAREIAGAATVLSAVVHAKQPALVEPSETSSAAVTYHLSLGGSLKEKARAILENGDWTLLADSKLNAETQPSLYEGIKELRDKLQADGVVVPSESGTLLLTRDVEFGSPSAAAQFVRGYSINGKWEWRRESDNKRYSEVLSSGG